MYKAYLNNRLFFDSSGPDETLTATSFQVTLEAGGAGSCSFTVPPTNAEYDNFHKLADYVDVYRDSELIFSGRVYDESKNFNLMQSISCEGLLAILNDTVFRPINFNGTLLELVTQLINNHNSQVPADKQVTIGTIEPEDEYIYRAFESYETTMTRLDDLVEAYGGYLSVVKSNGALIFNWVEEIEDENEQTIDFGENLLDLKQDSNASDVITVLIPLGAEIEDDDGNKTRVDIKSVNNNTDFIANSEALTEFGRIVGVMIWDDVTTPAALLTKGTSYLNDISANKVTIQAAAVDLANAGYDVDNFEVGKTVKVTSAAHGLSEEWFDVVSMTIDMLDPTKNKLSLGHKKNGYVGRTQKAISSLGRNVESINKNYANNFAIQQSLSQQMTAIEQNAASIILKASQTEVDGLSGRITSAESAIAQNAEQIGIYFGQNGKITSWFTFDENKFQIGKSDSPIHSEQDNQSYRFVDNSNNILLEINPYGTVSQTVNVDKQVAFIAGTERHWAIRKGKYITGKGVNLNDIWLGD